METLFTFLVNASAGIILFYIVYWIFLRNETFYKANRWFLFMALISAILLPLFPLKYQVVVEPENDAAVLQSISDTFKHIPVVSGTEYESQGFNWQQGVLLVYLTGASIFLLRLLTQTFILIHLIIKYRVKSLDGIRIVENERYGLPFSFFNVVFINPKFHEQENLPEILAHEKVHIRENHWFDLLFIELLTVIFWFNPFIWFFERSIKQNHEYLADKGVISMGHSVARYQALLLNQLMGMQIIGITNNLNFALNTNRLKMMTKKKTPKIKWVRFTWTLPVLAVLLYAFAEPSYRAKDVETTNSEITFVENVQDYRVLKVTGKVLIKETGEPLPGASIILNGTTIGTVVDLDGNFKLDVPIPKDDIKRAAEYSLVVSFVGRKTIYKKIGSEGLDLEKQEEVKMAFSMEEEVIGIGRAEQLIPTDKKIDIAPPPPPPPPPAPKGLQKEIFYIVEEMPEYPGGSDALNNYAFKMQQKIAKEKGVRGEAMVLFTVNAKGKVSDVKVVESDNGGAAKSAVAIISSLPDWKPGKQRGKAVPVKFMMPVEFK